MASLYLESLPGVHAHLKPLKASVEVSTEHAPPTGTVCKVLQWQELPIDSDWLKPVMGPL